MLGAITTVPGSASACSRAARFGVSPTTACSCAAPSPIRSPTTTSPVAIPTRTCNGAPRRGVEPGHRLDQRQPGPHRPLGIVLVGPRIAEIGEHPVAHVFGDKPAGAFDDRGDAAVIGADHRAQVLGIEPRRQCRRADQVAEHHRQLPPLGRR